MLQRNAIYAVFVIFFNIANLQQAAAPTHHPTPQQVRLLLPIYKKIP
jgi:hypothetical protein